MYVCERGCAFTSVCVLLTQHFFITTSFVSHWDVEDCVSTADPLYLASVRWWTHAVFECVWVFCRPDGSAYWVLVCWQISLSQRERERKKEIEEERKQSGKPFQSDLSSLCVFMQVYVWSSQPVLPACLPSLILSCRSSRLVLPDPFSAFKCHNQPLVLWLCLLSPCSRQGKHSHNPSVPFWASACQSHTTASSDLP